MYLMEGERETQRLEAKTNPEEVRRRLELVGIASGMRVLDAGAGSGAVSRLIVELVGPSGEVVALEGSADRAAYIRSRAAREGLSSLRVVEGDLYAPPVEPVSFDVVWSEFVFEYLAEPERAARALARLLRPGGKLVIADIDGYAMFHYPLPEMVGKGLAALASGLHPHFDPFVGRKLYNIIRKAGLRDVRVDMLPYHFYVGSAEPRELDHWRLKCETIRPLAAGALGGLESYDRWVEAFLEMLRDPDRFSYAVLFVVQGIK